MITGSASGIGSAAAKLLQGQGDRVTDQSGGSIDAILTVAGVDLGGPATVAINYYGALSTLEGLRPLLLKSAAPRAVAVSSITSVHPFDQQLLDAMLDGTEEQALRRAKVTNYAYPTTKRAGDCRARVTAHRDRCDEEISVGGMC
ncbi:MAG: Short-chain dehydrogenase/reductase [Nocardia sp.]|uniref:hypothetical protein n=1 Tax=Nocardia sp. TaxID=1821 RepID=UPI00260CB7B7|nr:hypothetical protein [Nocardia sp.]MCU1646099.1 Short-chain dehydrogenase/reductase [Nocardia sp.]